MIKNIVASCFRALTRDKVFLFINMTGLTIGIASCLLIYIYISNELSYDRHLKDSERTYRIYLDAMIAGNSLKIASTPAPLVEVLRSDFPEITETLRMTGTVKNGSPELITVGEEQFQEDNIIYADSNIFEFFGIKVIKGDSRPLVHENSVVMTQTAARKYFGDADPIGKVIEIPSLQAQFKVTAVVEEQIPATHFHYSLIASINSHKVVKSHNWLGGNVNTYVKVASNANPELLKEKLPSIVSKYVAPQLKEFLDVSFDKLINDGGKYEFAIQKITDIHLHSKLDREWDQNGDYRYIQIAVSILLLIVVIAGINFANLSTSKADARAREIGVRKVLGSTRKQLVLQFVLEAIMLVIISAAIALALALAILPNFNMLVDKTFIWQQVLDMNLLIRLLVIAVVLGFLAGFYPAVYMSAFRPSEILKGTLKVGKNNILFKNSLVVIQFLMVGTTLIFLLVLQAQIQFMKGKDTGIAKNGIVVVKNAADLGVGMKSFVTELKKIPGVQNAAYSSGIPGKLVSRASYKPDGEARTFVFPLLTVDHNFLDVYGIQISSGRNFQPDIPADTNAIILNETAVRHLGWSDALNRRFNSELMLATPIVVVGIVKDFHFRSLHQLIEPISVENKSSSTDFKYLSVRFDSNATDKTMQSVSELWTKFAGKHPFEYFFLDEEMKALYSNEERLSDLIIVFGFILIVIASLGLFGLVVHMISVREKEVGIRKVLGGSVLGIILLFEKQVLKPVAFALGLAIPITVYLCNDWMATFAYRTELGFLPFFVGCLLTLTVAVGTSIFFIAKAATANPVEVIRNNG